MKDERLRKLAGLAILTEAENFDKVLKKIEQQTDQNDHNGSVITLTKLLKNKKSEKIMMGIIEIQMAMKEMPRELITIRDGVRKELLKVAAKKLGKDKADLLHGAF